MIRTSKARRKTQEELVRTVKFTWVHQRIRPKLEISLVMSEVVVRSQLKAQLDGLQIQDKRSEVLAVVEASAQHA